MRNVLIPQGSEQTAKEGERQRKDREKKLESQRARKQDGRRTYKCPVWAPYPENRHLTTGVILAQQ